MPIFGRHETLQLVKHLDSLRRPERMRQNVHQFDDETVVTVRTYQVIDPCKWPGCNDERVSGGLCAEHNELITNAPRSWSCRWPECLQSVVVGVVCYRHWKVVEGLTES